MVAGFLIPHGWRWAYWVAVILGAVSFIPVLFLPETYAPIILQERARRLRKGGGNDSIYAPIEFQKKRLIDVAVVFMARPMRMIVEESIVLMTCLYLLLETGIYCQHFERREENITCLMLIYRRF